MAAGWFAIMAEIADLTAKPRFSRRFSPCGRRSR